MRKRDQILIISILLLLLITITSKTKVVAAQDTEIRARVTFQDGSTQEVENFKFVYIWARKSYSANNRKESNDFHYKDILRGVELDRVIQVEKISKIEFDWTSIAKLYSPNFIHITLNDGKKVSILMKDFDAASTFLTEKPIEQITDDTYVGYLYIEGIGRVEDQIGKFRAMLFASNRSVELKTDEAVKEIFFIFPKK